MICRNCKFFVVDLFTGETINPRGKCHRYPKTQNTTSKNWCGEAKSKLTGWEIYEQIKLDRKKHL